MWKLALRSGVWLLLLASCSGSKADKPKPAATAPDAGDADAAREILDAAVVDASAASPIDTDGSVPLLHTPSNMSFETARKLNDSDPSLQVLVTESQVDYYAFEAEAGKFYEIATDRSDFSPDNVITLFDPDRNAIARNDNGSIWPNDAIDARLVVRAARSGTYFITAEDNVTPAGYLGDPFDPLVYHMRVREIRSDTEGFALEQDDHVPDAVQLAHDVASGTTYVTLVGEVSPDDEDDFPIEGIDQQVMLGNLLTAGASADGSTADGLTLRLVSSDDQQVLASIDQAKSQANFHPPVAAHAYTMRVAAHGDVGDNPYYAINIAMLDDYRAEQQDATNDRMASAEPIALEGMFGRRGRVLAHLPRGDVDFYRFEPVSGEHLVVVCESESAGSGVRSLRAELFNPAQQSITSAQNESSTMNLFIDSFMIKTTGTHLLRLSSDMTEMIDGVKPDSVIDPWVRCELLTE